MQSSQMKQLSSYFKPSRGSIPEFYSAYTRAG